MNKYKNKKVLFDEYVVNNLSTITIAKMAKVNPQTISNWMQKFGIPRRGEDTCKKTVAVYKHASELAKRLAREIREGKRVHSQWKGGRIILNGYVFVYCPQHPISPKARKKYVQEHRLVMEKHLGRYLRKSEVVHHINGKRNDNRLSNLMLFPNEKAHREYHRDKKGRWSR